MSAKSGARRVVDMIALLMKFSFTGVQSGCFMLQYLVKSWGILCYPRISNSVPKLL